MSRRKGTIRINKRKFDILATTLCVILGVVILIAGVFTVMRMVGRSNMNKPVEGTGEEPMNIGEQIAVADGEPEPEEGVILYKGAKYRLNEDMVTILVMGIDKELVDNISGRLEKPDQNMGELNGGQADALFLALLNPHDKTISVIAINRNTMTDVDIFDAAGNYLGMRKMQVCLQHGYGDGGVESCLRQVRTVSRLFKGLAINSYAAISMDAIPKMNDAIGGVTVEVLEDINVKGFNVKFTKGDVVTLYGNEAFWYVKYRNTEVFDSASSRLARQKQYIAAFGTKAKQKALEDIRIAADLYTLMQAYTTTDMDINSFTYLASEASGYTFSTDNIYSLQGETVMGTDYEEFYADEEALEDLIIQLFYEPV